MISHRFLRQVICGCRDIGRGAKALATTGYRGLGYCRPRLVYCGRRDIGSRKRRLRLSFGYWGPHIGFYGGVDYGFGYDGTGYEGGHWKDGSFFYNSAVNNLTNVAVTNIYSKPVALDRTSKTSTRNQS